jgi:hypothetical protein
MRVELLDRGDAKTNLSITISMAPVIAGLRQNGCRQTPPTAAAEAWLQAWYGISQGAPTFLNPFINLFFHRLGLTPGQIGLLSALRPWISAPCGALNVPGCAACSAA